MEVVGVDFQFFCCSVRGELALFPSDFSEPLQVYTRVQKDYSVLFSSFRSMTIFYSTFLRNPQRKLS